MEQNAVLIFILAFLFAYLMIAVSHIYAKKSMERQEKAHGRYVQYWFILLKKCKESNDYRMKKSDIRKLKDANYLSAFESTIPLVRGVDFGRLLAENEKDIVTCAKKISNVTVQAYFVYVISTLDLGTNQYLLVEELLLEFIKKGSVYLRENVFLALYNLGNPYRICEAIKVLSEKNVYHHEKLISDGLLKCKADHTVLAEELSKLFDDVMDCYKIAIINYLRFSDNYKYNDKFRDYLEQEDVSVDIKCCIIRLLAKQKSDINGATILESLNRHKDDEEWEVAAVAAISLRDYNTEQVMEGLVKALTSRSWYVRVNSAKMLAEMKVSDRYLQEIFSSNDRYAMEALRYEISRKEMVMA